MYLTELIKECQSKFNICSEDIRLTVGNVLENVKLLLNDPLANSSYHWSDKNLIAALNGAIKEVRRRRYDARTDVLGRYLTMNEIKADNFSVNDLIAINGDFLTALSTYSCYILCVSEGHNAERRTQAEKFLSDFTKNISDTPLFVGINRFASWANSAIREIRRRYPETLIDNQGRFVMFSEIPKTGSYQLIVVDNHGTNDVSNNNGIANPEDILSWDKKLYPKLYFKMITCQQSADHSIGIFAESTSNNVNDALAIINVKNYSDDEKFAIEPTLKSKICGEIKLYQNPTNSCQWNIYAKEKSLIIDDEKFQNCIVYYMLYGAALEINNRDLADFYLKLFNQNEGGK